MSEVQSLPPSSNRKSVRESNID